MPTVRGCTAVVAIVIGAIGGGCAGRPAAAPNAGLEAMTRPAKAASRPAPRPAVRTPAPPDPADRAALAEMIRQQAVDTQRILDGHAGPPASPPAASPARAASAPALVSTSSADGPNAGTGLVVAEAPEPSPPVAPPAAAPVPATSIDHRVREAAQHLAELLEEQAAADPSLRPRAALAALDGLRLQPTPGKLASDSLTPAQRQVLDGLREAVRILAPDASPLDADADPHRLAEQLNALADRLIAGRGLAITDLRLCTRVRGFGQYTMFADSAAGAARFVAGQTQRALVYVELDRFTHRRIDAGDVDLSAARERGEEWVVDLSQAINLYSEHGNLLVHRRPPERVVETSRSKRRDFYLVTEITLPGTLGAGLYHLKVTVRDRTTGAVAERALPIELVADAAPAGTR